MSKRNQHVVPRDGGWAVQSAGGQRASSLHGTQQQAIEAARTISRNQGTELFIHRPNGQIRERDSHGRDTYPPKG